MEYRYDVDLINLQQQLVEHFSLSEMKGLCADLEIDYEWLAGENTTPDKARELVKFCYRHGRIPEIVQRCTELRPKEVWDKPKIYARDGLPDEWVEPLQRLYRLVTEFNRNRSLPFSDERTWQGDEIAFAMREAAPFLFGQFDVEQWLRSDSIGKRLAAVKYLDWLQDVEFLGRLLGMLVSEKPFLQFHVLLAIDSMLDQLDPMHRRAATVALTAYKVVSKDAEREYWRKRILSRLSAQEGSSPEEEG